MELKGRDRATQLPNCVPLLAPLGAIDTTFLLCYAQPSNHLTCFATSRAENPTKLFVNETETVDAQGLSLATIRFSNQLKNVITAWY